MGGILYTVKYATNDGAGSATPEKIKKAVQALLQEINQSFSTYLPDSNISRLNTQQVLTFEDHHFYEVLSISKTAYTLTKGAFDPTVGALVRQWGFGGGPERPHMPADSLRTAVGFEKIYFSRKGARKKDPNTYLDLSGVAKGYAVDVIARYLEQRHAIADYMVEVGGEIRCKGRKKNKRTWRIGIEDGTSTADGLRPPAVVLAHTGYAMATSGNYRNYVEEGGVRYGHIISPTHGAPAQNELLSASIIAPTCALADALATACMVMGLQEALALLQAQPKLAGVLMYRSAAGTPRLYASARLIGKLKEPRYPIDRLPPALAPHPAEPTAPPK